jgi:hypothetical protein
MLTLLIKFRRKYIANIRDKFCVKSNFEVKEMLGAVVPGI